LTVGLSVAAVSVSAGTVVGIVSGYYGGWWGAVLMRLADLTLALPFLPLVILLSAYLGPSLRNVILVLTLVSWAGPARLIRSRVLSLLQEPYVEAARALGSGHMWVMRKHLWPAVRNLVIAQAVLVAGISILAEASLSFLGLGDTTAKSWGTMLYFARASGAFLGRSWQWWVLPTGIMLALTVLSLVLIGYGFERRSARGATR
jgi:ABC-type dipeptide/oligopeptide/nickel transport system permease subunit